MSDDLNDLKVLRRVGLPIAVANAVAEVKKVAHYTTKARGGDGAVREVCDRIIKSQGLWNGLVRKLSGLDE
jgi:3-deoxy-D-manno-octulosonate 8-phosphate phosphatase (KDO 8-P phosphatase)